MGEKGAQIFSECQPWASIEVNIGVYCKTVSAVLSFVGGAQRKTYPQHGRMEDGLPMSVMIFPSFCLRDMLS